MSQIAYVNGRYLPAVEAAIHVEDRGFQFADGVYEVCEVRRGRLVDEARHLARLDRSLGELRIAFRMPSFSLGVVLREVVRQNRVRDGLVYLQVTRGVAPRAHTFPSTPVRPTLVVTARSVDGQTNAELGIAVVTVPETRWARVDIKTIALLPNVLAKQQAREAGAFEAWFVDAEGLVNEGAASNAWVVTDDGKLATAPTTAQILEGVTRAVVLETANRLGLALEERRFSVTEALAAREAFITSATTQVTPVIKIDRKQVGEGTPGATARMLRQALLDHAVLAPVLAGPVA